MRIGPRGSAALLAALVASSGAAGRAAAQVQPQGPPGAPVEPIRAGRPPSGAGPVYGESPLPEAPPMIVHRTRKGLMLVGFGVFGAAHAAALFFSLYSDCSTRETPAETSNCHAASDRFWIPFVGPWLALSADPGADSSHPTQDRAVAVVWGLIQVAGAVMVVVGGIGRDVPARPARRPYAMWGVVPTAARDGAGVALRAAF